MRLFLQRVRGTALPMTLTVALLSMIGPFTIDTYLPAFAAIEAEYDVSRAVLSQSIAFYLAAFALSTLFWGPLSDHYGRLPIIIGSLIIYMIASVVCASAPTIGLFQLGRLLQGVAAGGGLVAGRAMIRDAYSPAEAQRTLSHIMLLFAVAPAVAPILGGWLNQQFSWQAIFWFLLAYGSVTLLLCSLFLRETLALDQRQSLQLRRVLATYRTTFTHRRFVAIILSIACAFSGLFLFIVGSPTLLVDILGLSSRDFALQFVPMVGGLMAGSLLSGALARRQSALQTARQALLLMIIALVSNLLQGWLLPLSLLSLVIPLVIYAAGVALALPAFTLLAFDCLPANRGVAAALQGSTQTVMAALTAALLVPLLGASFPAFLLAQAGLLLLALLFWLLAGERSAIKPADLTVQRVGQ
ncbi:MAG: multidrug effflux MFS transporter [Gammaproteobacteria bacterium]|nr:multidrug effflux MFS transporter [Gammaproteobacteria bacterium]